MSKVKPKARAQFVDSFPMFLPLYLAEKRQADFAIRATKSPLIAHPAKNRALWSISWTT